MGCLNDLYITSRLKLLPFDITDLTACQYNGNVIPINREHLIEYRFSSKVASKSDKLKKAHASKHSDQWRWQAL